MSTVTWYDHAYVEKRQLFLRSYQFSRKQTTVERIRCSLARFRKGFGALGRARRVVWSGLRRHMTSCSRRRCFLRLSRWSYPGGGAAMESSAARDWFGTPCHWAWSGRKD